MKQKFIRINAETCGVGPKNIDLLFLHVPRFMSSDPASLLKQFLPGFILNHFEFKSVIIDQETFHIQFEELNVLLAE